MPKILLAIGVSVVSFLAGLIGLYLALPAVMPDHVEAVLADSLHAADTLAVAGLPNGFSRTLIGPDTTGAADSTGTPFGPSSQPLTFEAMTRALSDTVSTLRQRLHASEVENQRLQEQLTSLETHVAELQVKPSINIDELSQTLSKLEDRELQNLLTQFDLDLLGELYVASSGRNRVRLLQNMPSERAAQFVRNLRQRRDEKAPTASASPARPTSDALVQDAIAEQE